MTLDEQIRLAEIILPLVRGSIADVQAVARARGADDAQLAKLEGLWQAGRDQAARDAEEPITSGN